MPSAGAETNSWWRSTARCSLARVAYPRRAGRPPGWWVRHPIGLPEGLPHGVPGAELRQIGRRLRRGLAPGTPRGRALPGRRDDARAPACSPQERRRGSRKASRHPPPDRIGHHKSAPRPAQTIARGPMTYPVSAFGTKSALAGRTGLAGGPTALRRGSQFGAQFSTVQTPPVVPAPLS